MSREFFSLENFLLLRVGEVIMARTDGNFQLVARAIQGDFIRTWIREANISAFVF